MRARLNKLDIQAKIEKIIALIHQIDSLADNQDFSRKIGLRLKNYQLKNYPDFPEEAIGVLFDFLEYEMHLSRLLSHLKGQDNLLVGDYFASIKSLDRAIGALRRYHQNLVNFRVNSQDDANIFLESLEVESYEFHQQLDLFYQSANLTRTMAKISTKLIKRRVLWSTIFGGLLIALLIFLHLDDFKLTPTNKPTSCQAYNVNIDEAYIRQHLKDYIDRQIEYHQDSLDYFKAKTEDNPSQEQTQITTDIIKEKQATLSNLLVLQTGFESLMEADSEALISFMAGLDKGYDCLSEVGLKTGLRRQNRTILIEASEQYQSLKESDFNLIVFWNTGDDGDFYKHFLLYLTSIRCDEVRAQKTCQLNYQLYQPRLCA